MSYDTLYFAIFLAGVWLVFAIVPWRGCVLLAASIVFYSVAGLRDSLQVDAVEGMDRQTGDLHQHQARQHDERGACREAFGPEPADHPRSTVIART